MDYINFIRAEQLRGEKKKINGKKKRNVTLRTMRGSLKNVRAYYCITQPGCGLGFYTATVLKLKKQKPNVFISVQNTAL